MVLATVGLSLLDDVVLGTTLLGLALGTHLLVVSLTVLVTSNARDGASDGALSSVGDAGAVVAKLTLGLLLLALEVLLAAGCLERLG